MKDEEIEEKLNDLNTKINRVKSITLWAEDGSFNYQDFEIQNLILAIMKYLGIKPYQLDAVESIQFKEKKCPPTD